jgi:hypothetical protein
MTLRQAASRGSIHLAAGAADRDPAHIVGITAAPVYRPVFYPAFTC